MWSYSAFSFINTQTGEDFGILEVMKKIIVSLVVLLGITYASASTCVDLQSVLSKGAENSKVLALQNFLFEKGYLKAKPNGYFGGGTVSAVKSYQKSLGFEQAGSVGPGTRAAIKKETCGITATSTTTQINQGSKVTKPIITVTTSSSTVTTAVIYKPPVSVVSTPSALRNVKRREDLEKLLKNIYARFSDSRGVHPVAVTETPIELCVVPPRVISTATTTEVAVLVTPESPCKDYVDVSYLSPGYLMWIPRDPSLATTSVLTGYTITRNETNDITLSAKNPEDGAIIKVTCNFNGFCQDLKNISKVIYGTPSFSSSSNVIIIRDTTPKDPLTLYGKNFTATNTVVLLSSYTNKKYVLGTFASTNGTSLSLPATSTNQTFSCGSDCQEKIPLGDYSFTITNDGGTSNLGYLTFKGITTSSFSTHSNSSVQPKTNNVKVGSIAISAGVPIQLKSLTLAATSTSSVLQSKIGSFVLKESIEGTSFSGPTFSFTNQSLYENQSRVYDLYVNIAEVEIQQSGFITYGGTLTITDVVTNKDMTLPIKEIAFTVSY